MNYITLYKFVSNKYDTEQNVSMNEANNRLRLNHLGYLSTDDRLNGTDTVLCRLLGMPKVFNESTIFG